MIDTERGGGEAACVNHSLEPRLVLEVLFNGSTISFQYKCDYLQHSTTIV